MTRRNSFHLGRIGRRQLIQNIVAFLTAVLFLFPIYWIVISSFKTDAEIFSNELRLFPDTLQWTNYTSQLSGSNNMLKTLPNTVIVALWNMVISILIAVPAAYGIARFKLPGKRAIIMVFLTTQMIPASLVLTPMFLMYSRVGLLNTLTATVLSTATVSIPFTIVVLRPIFLGFPREIEEAARIDGCNRLSAFIRVILPISTTGLVTVGCFAFVHGWSNLVFNMTFNTDINLRTLPSGFYYVNNEYGMRWNMIMAYGVIIVLPVITLFILAQKYIIGGLTSGSVKG